MSLQEFLKPKFQLKLSLNTKPGRQAGSPLWTARNDPALEAVRLGPRAKAPRPAHPGMRQGRRMDGGEEGPLEGFPSRALGQGDQIIDSRKGVWGQVEKIIDSRKGVWGPGENIFDFCSLIDFPGGQMYPC